ncbi:MAG: tetratricopeptide repeat protein, partial [Gemmatimonadota bacterium]
PPQEDPIWYRSAEFPPIVWQGLYEPRRHYLRGVIALKLRDSTGLEAALGGLDSMLQSPGAEGTPEDAATLARLLRVWTARLTGEPTRALGLLGAVRLPHRGVFETLVDYPRSCERFLRAEVYRRLGQADEALDWYATFPDPTGHDLPYLAPSFLRRAEIHEMLGDRDGAIRYYSRFIELWTDADPALEPIVARARARIVALQR